MRHRTLALIGVALLAGAVTFNTLGAALAQSAPPTPGSPPAIAPWGPGSMPGPMMGPGMTGGPGMMGNGTAGPGMMGSGMMGNGATGQGMMAGPWTGAATPLRSLPDAQAAFQGYLDRLGNPKLALDEVMEFTQNYYAIVKDQSTSSGAFELLANKQNGAVFLEYGPAMMWNTQYGHGAYGHGGMMGAGTTGAAQTVSADRARELAQRWLDANLPGNQAEEPDAFPGYYTAHFGQGGQVTGMLSVNAYTGQIWYHTWHGVFVGEVEVGD